MTHGTGLRVALAAVLIAGSGVAGAGTAAAEPALDWRPCQENTEVECAGLTVPIDWARPSTGTIEVAVARRRATEPDARIGTLVYLPGGPGGSGVSALVGTGVLTPEIARRFDVVSLDPRGTNRSHPVLCSADLVAAGPNVIPDTGARLAEVVDHNRRLGQDCRAHTGPLIDHVDTASVARDMDALRAALGERQLSLYGISYGTLTGQMYAERFPRRVRAMVLDSVFDHSLSTRRFLSSEARAAEDSFGEFIAWCERERSCALHGQDVGAVFGRLYEKSLRGELHVPGDPATPLAPMDLIMASVGRLYGPHWAALAELLNALAEQGATTAQAAPDLVEFPIAMFCADHRFEFSAQREWVKAWRSMNRTAPTIRGHFSWPLVSTCVGWPARTGNPQHRTDIDGGPPVLLMNSRYDPATPHEWATGVARQIDNSVLLTYDGWGHRVYDRGECTLGAFHRYLIEGTTPARGTHCAAVLPVQTAEKSQSPMTGW
ncbi:alpha/beta hydrolase [Actinokineospora sp. 24-640]